MFQMAKLGAANKLHQMRGTLELVDFIGELPVFFLDKPKFLLYFRKLDLKLRQFVLLVEIRIEAKPRDRKTKTKSEKEIFHDSALFSTARNFALRDRGFSFISTTLAPIGFFVRISTSALASRKMFFTIRSSRL